MVAVLSRLLGLDQLETAQDIVQDTLLQAMKTWRYAGLPDQPAAWLYRVARNKAIDHLRREKKFREIGPQYGYQLDADASHELGHIFLEEEIEDSQLRMIFACCHPAIGIDSQIALALKTLCGLSNAEIARAFLTGEETIAKRIYRAREKIRHEGIVLELPTGKDLLTRLQAVLHSLYLLFNEGYNSSHPDRLIREDLCEEAMRLVHLLTRQARTNTAQVQALLSLFCFQASRLQARMDDRGQIVLLKHQDRKKWHRPLMDQGFTWLEQSVGQLEKSAYHLEAAIASLHAAAPSFEATDWKSIYFLYDVLHRLQPGPVVALNKAIAAAYAISPQAALEQLLSIEGLENYYLYHTSLGEIYFELGRFAEAKASYGRAMSRTVSRQEQLLLQEKIRGCDAG